ncbi:MAG TPA: efflux RND transporter periplasmic adaptor subunit [Bryobacteraceae bacterium]|nr:efflux RND transporter periplasmic adaptor subunit [Bryobacteraceae bacterium]
MLAHRGGLVAVVVLSSALLSCRGAKTGGDAAARETPVSVRVERPERIERPVLVAASGTVEAHETVDLGFQVAGRVARVGVEEGQPIRKGQILAELDATDYRFGLEGAEAQASAARATLDKARNTARPEELEQAKAAYDRAQDDYNRYRQLYERKSMAPVDFAKVEAAWRAARAQYEMAQNGARKEDRAAASAALDQAQAQVAVNRKRMADTRLTAPIAGIIARRGVDPGEMVSAGMPVFTIVNMSPTRVRVGIPETDIGRVHIGQRATVTVPALDEAAFQGKVDVVGVAADPNSRTFTAKIVVPNPGNALKAGMIAEVGIEGAGTINVLTVPGEAIERDPQGATLVYVYYRDRGRVHARRVEIGTVRGQRIEIRSGLAGDEQVVVAGRQKLREGAAVEVVR